MRDIQPELSESRHKIATLVDHKREGRFVIAFCPICDHAEEAEIGREGRDQTEPDSVAKIRVHISNRHRARTATVKISVISRTTDWAPQSRL